MGADSSRMSRFVGVHRGGGHDDGAHWLSVSDLMAGLMIIFLFIAIALMRSAFSERDQIREIAVAYQENQVAIHEALMEEFEADLPRWDARIDRNTLAFEFRSPDVLFERGEVEVQLRFQEILADFFPRYIEVIGAFRESIDEVRVEGHTSSDWTGARDVTQAYFNNMELSQGRTRSVLRFGHNLPAVQGEQDWIKERFAAVGFSSSRLMLDDSGEEDPERSRRVTFRVITNAETQIRRIIEDTGI